MLSPKNEQLIKTSLTKSIITSLEQDQDA